MLFKLSLREIRNHPKFVFLFVLNVSLGLIGLILIENFKISFNDLITARSQTLLGADFSISSRKALDPGKVELVDNWLKKFDKKAIKPSVSFFHGNHRKTSG